MTSSNRWPPIFGLGLTALLVFAVLPNPLRIPQNNPSATAEFAPVPGDAQDPNTANFGETGNATSGGLGAGGLIDPGAGPPPPPPELIFDPRNKSCQGDPPRQTPDPLSPPCVPFFDSDNGGSNGQQGVTKDTVRIIFYNDTGLEGDLTTPYSTDQEEAGHETSQNNEATYFVRTVKALLRYYSNHYQTYNRRIEMIAVKSAGITTPCASRKVDAAVINRDYHPFAVVHFGDGGQCFLNEMGTFGVPGFGLNSDVPADEFRTYPYQGKQIGMAYGFYPDQQTMAAWSAGFICRKLRGDGQVPLKARLSPSPDIQIMPRKFGLLYPINSQRGPESLEMAGELIRELDETCGIKPDSSGKGELYVKNFQNDGKTQAGSLMSDFKLKGITTVICYCVPVGTELTVSTYQQAATSLNYLPEWYWDHASRMFRAVWNRQHGQPNHVSFGTSYHWPNPRFEDQNWFRAYREIEPGTEPNKRFGFDIYHLFLNLFQGLQGAGPFLSPETIQQGMFTFRYVGHDPATETPADYYDNGDFQRPVGGYGSGYWGSTSPYTFIDTGFAWWWDSTGVPPGSNEQGCLRAVNGGRRYHATEWPEGDADILKRDQSSPCFQDDTSINKATQSGF